jgi:hypothetical protein
MPPRDDEGVDFEADDGRAVEHAAESADAAAEEEAGGDGDGRGGLGAEFVEGESADDGGEGVDRTDRQVDAAHDDDAGHADGHDGDKARDGRDADQVLAVEELVDLDGAADDFRIA